jgi:cysteinyl-tRNA synthetase
MALDILGDGFDLHGGGTDLAFPHHENERSESEAAGHPFARGWIHSAMLNIGGEKMSKSLNNFKTLGDVLDMWDPRALRLAMLQTHYRKVMELGDEAMQGATAALDRLDAFKRRTSVLDLDAAAPLRAGEVTAFTEAMEHDFGAPAAVATIFELVRAGHTAVDNDDLAAASSIAATIDELTNALGLIAGAAGSDGDDSEIDDLVAQRQIARDSKDFAESDRLRDELSARSIEVEDTAAGPIWRRV